MLEHTIETLSQIDSHTSPSMRAYNCSHSSVSHTFLLASC